jgi:prepilin-type N-terminal cleavage/methylation domain-containing protein
MQSRQFFFRNSRHSTGFTLIEVMIAVVVFVGVVVPLLAHIFGGKNQNRAQDLITATCFLEQEAKKAQVLPDNPAPEITRTINGVEWKIKWVVTGEKIQTCVAKVFKSGKFVTDACMYRHVK